MNTGLQDAYNLAWKLALVVVEDARVRALLDSYEAERMPVAKRLLSTTDRAFQLIVSDSRAGRTLPHARARERCGICNALRQNSKARVSNDLPDRYRVPRQPAIGIAAGAGMQARRAQAIVFRGCGSSCSRTAD